MLSPLERRQAGAEVVVEYGAADEPLAEVVRQRGIWAEGAMAVMGIMSGAAMGVCGTRRQQAGAYLT